MLLLRQITANLDVVMPVAGFIVFVANIFSGRYECFFFL